MITKIKIISFNFLITYSKLSEISERPYKFERADPKFLAPSSPISLPLFIFPIED
jgi:hypothetical protein